LDAKSEGGGPRFFYSVTRDPAKGIVYLKVVNASSVPQAVTIKLTGANQVKSGAKMITLSAKTTAETNTISESAKIVPVESVVTGMAQNFSHTFAPNSISVIEVEIK
jgi:alpha-N-arabinofuranosidase